MSHDQISVWEGAQPQQTFSKKVPSSAELVLFNDQWIPDRLRLTSFHYSYVHGDQGRDQSFIDIQP